MLHTVEITAMHVTGMGNFVIWIDVARQLWGFMDTLLLDIGFWNDIFCHPRGCDVAVLVYNHHVSVCQWNLGWMHMHHVQFAPFSSWIPYGMIRIHVGNSNPANYVQSLN